LEGFSLEDVIAGRNPVKEALRSGRPINKILIAEGGEPGPLREIFSMARRVNIPVQKVDRQRLNKFAPETAHQGVVALAAAREYVEVEDILKAVPPGEAPLLMLLDEIHDPHNLGAILRTAEAAGINGVVIPRRRSAPLTRVVAKSSAGAVEYVPVARVARSKVNKTHNIFPIKPRKERRDPIKLAIISPIINPTEPITRS
jgi:23S rRNA (guanosine2251-2'-O)-methyltransferase